MIEFARGGAFRRQVDRDLDEILAASLPWENLADKTVFVTGATGFIGSYLVETLLRASRKPERAVRSIVAYVRSRAKAERRFAGLDEMSKLVVIEGDVSRPATFGGAIDYIIHAASPASPRHYLVDPVGVMRANLGGTEWLLELARRHDARMLFFSSGEVYGQSSVFPTSEDDYGYFDPTTVRACYGESKRAAETMCVAWAHQFGTRVSMVRPFHTYGPGIALDDGRVFADFVADVVAGRDIVMHSDGLATRAFCYIADATEAFFTILFRGERGTAYNVGNPAGEINILGLAEMLVGLYPEKGLKLVRDPGRRDDVYAASPVLRNGPAIDRIGALGWAPRTSIEEGFTRMVGSYL